jgi:hypothetical protein
MLFARILLAVAGLINFLPVIGLISAGRIAGAYDVDWEGRDLELLLRHRALLFGLVGGFLLASVFVPAWQWQAISMAGLSMLGFLYLAWELAPVNAALQRIVVADLVGLACLVAGAVLIWLLSPGLS